MKKRVMKQICLILAMCLMLAGCGTAAQTTGDEAQSQTTEASVEAKTTENMAAEGTSEESEAEDSAEEATKEDSKEEGTEEEAETEEEEKEPLVYTGPVQALDAPKTLYSVGSVNVRTGPGTEYDKVDALSFNETIEATGMTENGWYQYMSGEQSCFVSGKYLSENKQEPKPAAPETPAANAAAPAPETPAAPAAVTAPAGVIMIGDSRCVQMQAAVGGGGCSWVCENSKGYKWLNEKAIGNVDPSVGKGTKVVFCLGVNDPGNVQNYANLVNAKAAEWAGRGAKVYYVSVNPVWENPHVTQEQVDVFNNTMPSLLSGVTWIDTQSWLKQNGYKLVDGLHYDDATSTNIFNLIMGSI